MPDNACPLPTPPAPDELNTIRRLSQGQRIAIVGLSNDPSKPSHAVAEYLLAAGKQIIPVNPNHATVMGLHCYHSLSEVPEPIDVVDVFRPADACPQTVREAIAAGAHGIWLQAGIVSEEARQLAAQAKIDFVQNRCLMVEHRRLSAKGRG